MKRRVMTREEAEDCVDAAPSSQAKVLVQHLVEEDLGCPRLRYRARYDDIMLVVKAKMGKRLAKRNRRRSKQEVRNKIAY